MRQDELRAGDDLEVPAWCLERGKGVLRELGAKIPPISVGFRARKVRYEGALSWNHAVLCEVRRRKARFFCGGVLSEGAIFV